MSDQMKAVVCHGPMDYKLEDITIPKAGPGEALRKGRSCWYLRK